MYSIERALWRGRMTERSWVQLVSVLLDLTKKGAESLLALSVEDLDQVGVTTSDEEREGE
ncbi:hypothetical protein N9L68_05110 [bacterium]|nr:hypothetical protein [bacterium]